MFKSVRISLAVSLAVLASCGSRERETGSLMVSIPPEQTLVEQIAGDRFKVECLMKSNANPESFEPSMGSLVSLENSDAYFVTGTLDFERNLIARLGSSDVVVANLSENVDLLYGTHGDHHEHGGADETHRHGHHHGSADPHIWSSPRNLKAMARQIKTTLVGIDPEGKEIYETNLKVVENRLDSLDREIAARLDTVTTRTFVVWHPSLSYFARDYDMEQLTIGTHGKEQSVKQLHDRLSEADRHGARVFFMQDEFDSRQAEPVKSHLGLKTVSINPMNADYETELIKIADAFCR